MTRLRVGSGIQFALIPNMRSDERAIVEVVRTFSNGREQISVVRCCNGTFALACDGVIVDVIAWNADQLRQCLAFAEHFARTANPDGDGEDGKGNYDGESPSIRQADIINLHRQ